MKWTGELILFLLLLTIRVDRSWAGLLRVKSESIMAVRRDTDKEAEVPFYEYFQANYISGDQSVQVDSSFSFFADPVNTSKTDEFNLYTLAVDYKIVPGFIKFHLGRSFHVFSTVKSISMDTVGAEMSFFEQMLMIGTFVGTEGFYGKE